MPTSDPVRRPGRVPVDRAPFILYVEGPRDRSILRAWAYRLLPEYAPGLLADSVILGGRRPARALEDFRARARGSRALCVLDRDAEDQPPPCGEAGLEFFTWGRRHIESYLLVPAAIRRALGLHAGDHRVEALLNGDLPAPDDSAGWRALDAKRLLAPRGPLARALGGPLPLARIARATRPDELPEDVHAVFRCLRAGIARSASPAARRSGPSAPRRPR